MIKLREYQVAAIRGQWDYWANNDGQAPVVIAPTGSGKSILIAETIRRIRRKNPVARIMMVAHVKELIQQNVAELTGIAPELTMDVGIVSAGLGIRKNARELNIRKPIVAGTIQTLVNHVGQFDPFSLMIVDEAHLVPRDSTTQYRTLIADLKEKNEKIRILGYTATPWRLDSGSLYEGPNAIFDGVAYEIGIPDLIKQGFLCKPVSRKTDQEIDATKLRKVHGEFTAKSQESALSGKLQAISDEMIKETADRKRILVFLPGVPSCMELAKILKSKGESVEIVHSKLNSEDRDEAIRRFREGESRWCCNVGILTTGSNIPAIDCISLVRATNSTALLVQMVGRGLRPLPGKSECVVLDYGRNFERHGKLDALGPGFGRHAERKKSSRPQEIISREILRFKIEREGFRSRQKALTKSEDDDPMFDIGSLNEYNSLKNLIKYRQIQCAVCNEQKADEIDHIMRRSRGGYEYRIENLQPLCRKCHAIKTRKELRIQLEKGETAILPSKISKKGILDRIVENPRVARIDICNPTREIPFRHYRIDAVQEGETIVQIFVREQQDVLKKLNGEAYEGSLLMDDDPWPATWKVESRDVKIWTTYSERRGIRVRYRCRDSNDRLREVKQWFFPESENDWERRNFRIEHRKSYKGENPDVPSTNKEALAASKRWAHPERVVVDILRKGKFKGMAYIKSTEF